MEEAYPGERADIAFGRIHKFIEDEFEKLNKELDAMVPEPPKKPMSHQEILLEAVLSDRFIDARSFPCDRVVPYPQVATNNPLQQLLCTVGNPLPGW